MAELTIRAEDIRAALDSFVKSYEPQGAVTGIEEGQEVRRTGEVLSVPVGDGYLGRVVDPLGQPIDGLGDVATSGRRALELQAPGVMMRKSVHEPLQTGLK